MKMFIPSLDDKKTITVDNVTKSEAEAFASFWDFSVTRKRKINRNDDATPAMVQFFTGNVDLTSLDEDFDELDNLVENLMTSRVPQKRGRRIVIVDTDTNEVGVGTTVVYNQNWAMRGVDDDTVPTTLAAVATKMND
jgi:hypothetical protein